MYLCKSKDSHRPGTWNVNLCAQSLHACFFKMSQDIDSSPSSKKPAPLHLFSAADIVQVVPSYSTPIGLHWRDGRSQSE